MISRKNDNKEVFLALVKAGLWENSYPYDSWLKEHDYSSINWQEVYRLADEQAIMGIVASGIKQNQDLLHLDVPMSFVMGLMGKANSLLDDIFESGCVGHNRDSNMKKYSFVYGKAISLWKHTKDRIRCSSVFPRTSIIVWCYMVMRGMKEVLSNIFANNN